MNARIRVMEGNHECAGAVLYESEAWDIRGTGRRLTFYDSRLAVGERQSKIIRDRIRWGSCEPPAVVTVID